MSFSVDPRIDRALAALPSSLLARSGKVFYSGRGAFAAPRPVYVLGLNPGGSPTAQASETIAQSIDYFHSTQDDWSAYADEKWGGHLRGTHGMQPRVLHLFDRLNLDPRQTPSSNVVFVRSATESDLAQEKSSLLEACWPVHAAVISALNVRAILCFGNTTGSWTRARVGATGLVDDWCETNARKWRGTAHANAEGLKVFTLTHPGRANWRASGADPSDFVARNLGV